jgi:hypothetical protein
MIAEGSGFEESFARARAAIDELCKWLRQEGKRP